MKIIGCLILIFYVYIPPLRCTLKNDTYQNIDDFYPCVYYSSLDGGVGCSSSRNGNNGRIWNIASSTDLNSLSTNPPSEPIIAYLDDQLFTSNTIDILEKQTNIQGIIIKSSPSVSDFDSSPANICPNESPFNKKCTGARWNPTGNSFLYRKFNYPIFLVDNPEEIKKINHCLSIIKTTSSVTYTKCGVHMSSFMYSRNQPSTVCLKRNESPFMSDYFCKHLNGISYWASVGDYMKDFKNSNELIVLSAALDGRSLFYGKDLNAESSLSGLISLLSVIHILGHWKRENNIVSSMNKNIVIFLNNKEAFEFAGSKTLAYQLKNERFPTNNNLTAFSLNNIAKFIDFNQLAFIQETNRPVYLHSNQNSDQSLVNVIKTALNNAGLTAEASSLNSNPKRELPPSSLVAFHQLNPAIKGVVLADFDTQFQNKRYLSHLDNDKYIKIAFTKSGNVEPSNNLISKLEKLSVGMAKAVLELAGVPSATITSLNPPDELMIKNLLTCIINDIKCSLFQEVYKSDVDSKAPLIRNGQHDNHLIYKRLLAYFLGNVKSITKKPVNCSAEARFNIPNYYSFATTSGCVLDASVYDIHTSLSYKDTHSLPLWTASEHDPFIFRLYLISSSVDKVDIILITTLYNFLKYVALGIGLVATALTIGLSIFLTRLYNNQMNLLHSSTHTL